MATHTYLDKDGVLYLWGKVKGIVPTNTSQLTNDSGFITSANISGKLDTNGNGSNVTVAFTQAGTRTNIVSGESLATLMGKIEKYFTDLSTVSFSGSYNDLTNKPTIPTDNSQLANGAGYQTATQVQGIVEGYDYQTASDVTSAIEGYGYQNETQVRSIVTGYGYQNADQVNSAIAEAVGDIETVQFSIVKKLPSTGASNIIYLVPASSTSTQNIYDEYIWIATSSSYEKIGSTAVDLSGYVQESELVAITNQELDEICV